VFEAVVAAAADAEPGVAVERGVRIRGLAVDTEGARPRVTGVHTAKGTRTAELVVDATGRRTPVPAWLAGLDAAPAQQAVDAGFVYYTRAYRGDALPPFRGGPLTEFGTFSVLTLPADNATWTVTLYGAAGDRPLKRVRDPAAFEAVVRACPLQAHWLDGEPLTGVVAMGGTLDRRTRYVDAAGPVATGIAPVGDAWACTNPSIGRGIALGALHAVRLRDMVRDAGLADLHAFALAYDAATEAELGPWYEETVARDHRRMAEMTALREGRTPDPSAELADAFPAAAVQDPDVYRAFLEVRGCLATEAEVLARPGLAERIRALTDDRPGAPPPGPDRDALLALVG
jgi:2-polyprenyl-6-methoxyphenol hydroxylase-like FAD-dependent oxidoreductase